MSGAGQRDPVGQVLQPQVLQQRPRPPAGPPPRHVRRRRRYRRGIPQPPGPHRAGVDQAAGQGGHAGVGVEVPGGGVLACPEPDRPHPEPRPQPGPRPLSGAGQRDPVGQVLQPQVLQQRLRPPAVRAGPPPRHVRRRRCLRGSATLPCPRGSATLPCPRGSATLPCPRGSATLPCLPGSLLPPVAHRGVEDQAAGQGGHAPLGVEAHVGAPLSLEPERPRPHPRPQPGPQTAATAGAVQRDSLGQLLQPQVLQQRPRPPAVRAGPPRQHVRRRRRYLRDSLSPPGAHR